MNSKEFSSQTMSLDVDWPIESRKQDLLDRRQFADKIARQISAVPVNQGFTIAVTGEWGSGKTSILNMVAETLDEHGDNISVLKFNPWLFGGADDLVVRFFGELSAQLGHKSSDRLRRVARRLSGLGQALAPLSRLSGIPMVTEVVGFTAQVTASLTEPPSLHKKRDELKSELNDSGVRLVVFIDDIDRLEQNEIREIMRLVRLTSDLPNVVYLLAFDRRLVAKSLANSLAGNGNESDGRRYLDKIVQDSYDLPVIAETSISSILVDRLYAVIKDRELIGYHDASVGHVISGIVKPLLANLRDVKRFMNVLPLTLDMVGHEVALADILGLEALRILRPEIYDEIRHHPEYLVHSEARWLVRMPDDHRMRMIKEGLLAIQERVGDDRKVFDTVCEMLFPESMVHLGHASHDRYNNKTWRRERRVACEEVLQIYFRGGLDNDALTTHEVNKLIESLTDEYKLKQQLDALDNQRLRQALTRISDFEFQFSVEAARVSVPVFVNLMGRLSEDSYTGRSDEPLRSHASTIASQLLRRVDDPKTLKDWMPEILNKVNALSGWLHIIELLESVDFRFIVCRIDENYPKELQRKLVSRLESATAKELSSEWDLFVLLYRTLKFFDGVDGDSLTYRLRQHLSDEGFVLNILCTAIVHYTRGGHTEKLLSWDNLLEVFGEEFADAVERLAHSPNYDNLDPDDQYFVKLAQKYVSGWRPEGFP